MAVLKPLGTGYPASFVAAVLDRAMGLTGPCRVFGFEQVPEWRWQQELTLAAANPGRRTMTQAEIERFVLFFERVSRRAWVTLPGIADWTVRLDGERRVVEGPVSQRDTGGASLTG